MDVLVHGVDIVETARIAEMIQRHGPRFLERCFTQAERDYAMANPRRAHEHLAVRFAAKEAVLKALGTGWAKGIAWTDVEVVREASGRPTVKLCGRAAEIAETRDIRQWALSLSHAPNNAIASVLGGR